MVTDYRMIEGLSKSYNKVGSVGNEVWVCCLGEISLFFFVRISWLDVDGRLPCV